MIDREDSMTANKDEAKTTIKAIERMLYGYVNTNNRINAMQIEIELLESEHFELNGMSENDIKASTPTNQISNSIENNVINKVDRINYLKEKIVKEQFRKRIIDNAMNVLDINDREFIKDRYFRKISPRTLASSMYCTESWIFIRSRNIIKEQLSQYIMVI